MTGLFIIVKLMCISCLWFCGNCQGFIAPIYLRLWRDQIEVSSRSLEVTVGSDFTVTCDGSVVGSEIDPRLRWYGPDKHWIAYEGTHNRLHVTQSFSRRYLRLHMRRVTTDDAGMYYCRGWLGVGNRWDLKSFRLVVVGHVESTNTDNEGQDTSITRLIVDNPSTRGPTHHINDVTSALHRDTTTVPHRNVPEHRTTEIPTEATCLPSEFHCTSGECIRASYLCNNTPDCRDDSDEDNCASATCSEGMIACRDEVGCVLTSEICDGRRQCSDGSDEEPEVCAHVVLK